MRRPARRGIPEDINYRAGHDPEFRTAHPAKAKVIMPMAV